MVGGRDALALLLRVSVAAIGNWKTRGVPFEQCVPIERATNGAVTRRDLRPSDYFEMWPELARELDIRPAVLEATQRVSDPASSRS